jgi:hypothetical protein
MLSSHVFVIEKLNQAIVLLAYVMECPGSDFDWDAIFLIETSDGFPQSF